jgi:succinate dehydrogenase/fumarate reductase flavoprotein subunit
MNSIEKWDMEYDVVMVGYGAAGAVAAVTAHDNGADVVILEKMPRGGGNSRLCGGNTIVPRGIEFADYLKTLSFGTTEPEIIEMYVREAMKNGDWLREQGGKLAVYAPLTVTYPAPIAGASFPQVAGSEFMDKYIVKEPATEPSPSQRLWNLLSGAVERRDIRVMTGTPARELVRNQNGEIIGVLAENDNRTIAIQARRGVILTCGGFENDAALKWDNLPCKPMHFLGNPGNTGDGIRMAQKIGAALWHMPSLSCSLGFQAPEYEAAFPIMFLNEGFIYVDKHGRRFVDEAGIEIHEYWREFSYFDTKRIEYPRLPIYAIFDEQARLKGPLHLGTSGFNRDKYKWSPDNSAEIAKGWIIKADTIAELAKSTSVDESTLENTINKYNDYCRAGNDADFQRAREDLRALECPPYYAIKLWPSLINTQGGPRRDIEARVLDPDGKPIPRLYAAGELGSIWGFLYQGANNIGECMVFGRIAGKNAAAEKPL